MRLNKTLVLRILAIIFMIGTSTARSNQLLSEVEEHIQAGNCDAADSVADKTRREEAKFLIYAVVAIECRKNEEAGKQYLRQAARLGNITAIKSLIEMGETPPDVVRNSETRERAAGIDRDAAARYIELLRQQQESRRGVETRCSRVGNETICRTR